MSGTSTSHISRNESWYEFKNGCKILYNEEFSATLLKVVCIVAGIATVIFATFFSQFYLLTYSTIGAYCLSSGLAIPATLICTISFSILVLKIKETCYLFFQRNHIHVPDDDREIILILIAEEDHNGALAFDRRDRYKELEKKYVLVFKHVSSIDGMTDALKENSIHKKIKILWINAHGSPDSFTLSKSNEVTTDNFLTSGLSQAIKNHLSDDATIVIESCEVGSDDTENIALTISQSTGLKVFAPRKSVNSISVDISTIDPLDVKFYYQIEPTQTCSKITKIFYLLFYIFTPKPYKYKYWAEDITYCSSSPVKL